ncbi:MAG: Dabb family protein [Acidimicrobiales bacterium]
MLCHVVVFDFKPEVTEGQVDQLAAGLELLAAKVDSIRSYRFGPDVGARAGNSRFALVAEFDDLAGFVTYAEHPMHLAFIAQQLTPLVASRRAVQFEFPPG